MNTPAIQGAGLNPNSHIQLTEHLGPLCAIMDMPLLLTDEIYCQQVHEYYPDVKTIVIPWEDVTLDYLIQNFNFLFQSEYWNRKDFYEKFSALEKEYNKIVRNVHCPHGFSDKSRWFQHFVYEDIGLVYGDNMLDMFKEMDLIQHLNAYVKVGNYRYAYYLKHQNKFDKIAEDVIWSHFSSDQKTILYAPSWFHEEDNPSIYDAAQIILDNLPSEYNLVFKVHPRQEHVDAPHLYRMMGKYEKRKNIVFVKDLSLIYPILARSDLYIGDMSAVGYDFLTFNRPMFFLNQNKLDAKVDRRTFLYRCGTEILPEQYHDIYSIIESQLADDQNKFGKIRKETYLYTFGEPISDKKLREAITQAYYSPKKFD